MKCDYCGSEMFLNENMYICSDCLTTYIIKNGEVVKKYVVPDEFAKEYKKYGNVLSSNNSEQKFSVAHRLLQIYSNCPILWNTLGVLYREKNQIDDALKCYEKALNLNPGYTQSIVNIAISYYALNNLKMANQKMEIAYAMMDTSAPNYAAMLGNYALILGKLGDKKKAAKLINEAEARGYKNGAVVRKEIGIGSESKEDNGKGFFEKLKEKTQQVREDAAVRKAYQAEAEKRKSHVKRIRHERTLTPQEQQTIDMLEAERETKILQFYKGNISYFDATFPYNHKIEEIKNRAIWYEEVVIPPEIDPSVPIMIDEEAIRRSVRKW